MDEMDELGSLERQRSDLRLPGTVKPNFYADGRST